MKVLHLPTSVGGQSWALAQGEKKIGLDSRVLIASDNWFKYPYDICLELEKRSIVGRNLKIIKTFLEYRNKFDIFHFNFGLTLLDFLYLPGCELHHPDLPFYPKRKKIIFTYNGCDARQKYKAMRRNSISPCHEEDCYGGVCNSGEMDKKKEVNIAVAAKYAHHIFSVNPDLLYYLPPNISSFLPYAIAGWYEIQKIPYSIGKNITIIHSPTNRGFKGSSYIIRGIENLKKRYKNIELILIENVPNKEAIELYKKADLVIDQVLAGWYGGFAVEVMKMGKPVAVYIRDEDLKFVPEAMAKDLKEAIINITPSNIESVLEEYMQNTGLLVQKAEAGLEYVHKWHDPTYVAGLTKEKYEAE